MNILSGPSSCALSHRRLRQLIESQGRDASNDRDILRSARRQGISRRSFLKFCSLTAASLGLGPEFVPTMASALETKPRTPVLWLHGLECTCCSEAFIRSAHPLASDVILSMISLDYDDTIMAAAGHHAEFDHRRDRREVRRKLHPRLRGKPAAQRRRHVLHHRRQALSRPAEKGCLQLQGHHLVGQLRLVGLRAGGKGQPNACGADPQGDPRQADHQGARLPRRSPRS